VKLDALLSDIRAISATGPRDSDVRGVVCDSRQVAQGFLFVAIPGQDKNGGDFIHDAIDRGAVAIVADRNARIGSQDICLIRVADARLALAQISCTFHGNPSAKMKMIGLTGTNGKTTTSYMIRNILRNHGDRPGLIGTIEYEMGERVIPARRTTPEAPVLQSMLAQMANSGCGSVVMEVSSHSLDQKRVFGIDYDVAVFTNLTRDHLDYHETMEKYFEAKSLLFQSLGKGSKHATAVLNTDDQWGRKLSQMSLQADILTYGLASDAAVRAENIELTSAGTSFKAVTPWGTSAVKTRLLGRFNVYNSLAAIAACASSGIQLDAIARALAEMVSVSGRLEEIKTDKGFHVFVDYAHTDDALENVLQTLREMPRRRIILVFGCGGNRDKTKRPLMGKVAAQLADFSFITSDNPRKEVPASIIAEIRAGFGDAANFDCVEDRAEAIRKALAMAQKDDIVLVAGKGHESFQEFANTTIAFDDRQVVKRYL
jgi:UDP-N-acetylmuramoyl-L-alanyl-D-glutamate--2,6-diaminopimelate ligase